MLMQGYQSIHQPLVCLSVPPTVLSCFSANCLSSFRPPTARLSVHPSVYPLLFFSTSLVVSTAGYPSIPPTVHLSVCLSVCLPVLSCFSANCQSPFRPQAVCLFTGCLSPFLTQTVRRAGCGLRRTRRGDSKK